MRKNMGGKERILSTARSLMIENGYGGTSLHAICEGADVQKGTFYYHFKTKEELGKDLVAYHLQCGADMMKNAPFLKETDPFQRLIGYVDWVIEGISDPVKQGCLLGAFSNDIAGSSKGIQSALVGGFDAWALQLEGMVKDAGLHDDDIDARQLADFFIACFEGGLLLARGKGDVTSIKNSLTHYKNYLIRLNTTGVRTHAKT
jgi:TetR/AcrR family transcriptional repressor of nem operon